MASRILIHCDLDAFFAAVETLHHNLDPEVPLILGSDPKGGKGRGIVSTCNYAARKYGIRSAMPITEAWRRCPGPPYGNGHYLKSTRGLYSRASRKVMKILAEHADRFEQASIDEAYLDVTDYCDEDWDKALALTQNLQKKILDELGLSTSFGIGPTRILAKMGSEENKPAGIHRTLPDQLVTFFDGRSVREVPGIGPKTATRLAEWGISTMSEAAEFGEIALARFTSERFASWIIRVIEGETSDDISPLRSRKSVGKEHTFEYDQTDSEHVLDQLSLLVSKVMKRAKEMNVAGRLGEVKIRYQGFETHTHGRSIPVAMDDETVFMRLAHGLFAEHVDLDRPIRLVGFRLGNLEMPLTRQSTLDLDE
ncbi:MAG: DNA polymerase IV [Candidatus Poseidoniales archaeon]|nr:DNA polymerase IV [Candidatus Poseidoniales archaeon]|tara:strand:- start:1520 stop:2620 length:1101 start_codon:yes stop_codon:yes gene_type:complete